MVLKYFSKEKENRKILKFEICKTFLSNPLVNRIPTSFILMKENGKATFE